MERKFYLKERLKEKGMTNVQLAKELGYTKTAVSNMARGVTLPSLNTLERIATIMGLPIAAFFEEKPNKEPPASGCYCPHCGKRIIIEVRGEVR